MTIRSRVRRFYEDAFRYGTAVRRVIGFDEQRFDLAVMEQNRQEGLRIMEQAAENIVNPPVITPDPDHAHPELETVLVNDVVMSGAVRRWLIDSGPVDMVHDMSTLCYRVTGPNIVARLHRAVGRAGERPIHPDEIVRSDPITATEVRERQHEVEEQIFRRRIANRALTRLGTDDIRPGVINFFPGGLAFSEGRDDSEKVERKARAALWRYLNERQHEDLFCLGHFMVNGGESKTAYKILKGRQGNVHQDKARFCLTHGDLPVWDLMLAQKLMIEDDEPKFLKMANRLDEPNFGIVNNLPIVALRSDETIEVDI